jgi:tRNA threonylcarbamoyladenosine biosynthesis protein TsaB
VNPTSSPPLILAIDTSGPQGGLALARGTTLLESLDLASPDGFGHVLFDALAALLDCHGVRASDIDCFAAASGPGSFTGIRVALSAAKGLAEATGKPVYGISNLQAMATYGTGPVRAPFYDARRGEVFAGLFGAALGPLAEETHAPLGDWLASLPLGVELLTPDLLTFDELIGIATPCGMTPANLAPAVASLALSCYLRGESGDPLLLDANYVRRSDAELNWRDVR